MIYLLAPSVTKCAAEAAVKFCAMCEQSLRRHVPTTPLDTEPAVRFASAGASDAAILFNPTHGANLSRGVTDLLRATGQVFPVAMTKSSRQPPHTVSVRQSFDVEEFLALRGGDANVEAAGAAFAREVLAEVQPSLTRSRMSLFLSYRRVDGEDRARELWTHLQTLRQRGFRDLADIHIGESALDVVESRLHESDAVLFCDTPLAHTSEWVEREIRIALRNGIPIVWIKAGEHTLPYRFPHPAQRPHLTLGGANVSLTDAEGAVSLAADLVRESAVQVLDSCARLKALDGLEVKVEDLNRLLYSVRIRCGRMMRFPQECTTHLVQFFGTHPRSEDAGKLAVFPGKYTARLLLVRAASASHSSSGDTIIGARADDYVDCLEDYLSQLSGKAGKGLILSGAFPDACTPRDQQDIVEAVRAFADRVLERGGTIIFGAHPTFVPLIVEAARQKRPGDLNQAIRLYYSEHFVKDASQYADSGTVIAVPDAGERNASLAAMRQRMIEDPNAAGLVAIGGRLARPGIVPGVDEELALARAKGLPAFLIGSVQGRSAELAAELAAAGWAAAPNDLGAEENERLRTSFDYAGLASMVLRKLES